MITIRSPLILFSVALLSGCFHDPGPPCPLPGPLLKSDCYYLLTIIKNDTDDVRARVAKAAVEQNIAQLDWKTKAYKIEDYQFLEFPIRIDKSIADKLKVGEDRWFVGRKDTDYLSPYTPPKETSDKYKSAVPWDSTTAK